MWPFSKQAATSVTSNAEPPSGLNESLSAPQEDYSSKNPYYRLANSLAWSLDEEPNDEESLSAFVTRWTLGVVLEESEIEEAKLKAAKQASLFADPVESEKFHLLEMKVKIRVREEALAKESIRMAPNQAEREEILKVRDQLKAGLNLQWNQSILTSEKVQKLVNVLRRKDATKRRFYLENLVAWPEVVFNEAIFSVEELDEISVRRQATRKVNEINRLRNAIENGEEAQFDSDLVSESDLAELYEEMQSFRYKWLNERKRPAPQPYGVSNFGAEHLVADWLEYLGEEEVVVTQASQDGGADVLTIEHVCQVKNYKNQNLSVQEIREIFGVAALMGKKALIFSSAGITSAALDFANQAQIPVVQFNAAAAWLVALNEHGADFLSNGSYED